MDLGPIVIRPAPGPPPSAMIAEERQACELLAVAAHRAVAIGRAASDDHALVIEVRGGAARGAREARVHAARRRERGADGEHVVQEGGVARGLALVRSVAAVVVRTGGREPELGDVEGAPAPEGPGGGGGGHWG